MFRRYFLRLPIFWAVPRVTAPLLPLTYRLRGSPMLSTSTSRLFHYFPRRLLSSPPPSPSSRPPEPDTTLSQRLRKLIKLYGWYALGVYIVLSALDFGVAFAGINLLGAEQVSYLASLAKELVARVLPLKPSRPEQSESHDRLQPPSNGQEGLWAMLVLAWTIHKTVFFPVRVGFTAALTPRLVRWLDRRGWVGGEGTRRAANEMRERLRSRE
jgi:N-terminal acetyltransferase 2